MGDYTKLMSIVFNIDEPLLTRDYPSDIVKYNTFTTVQTNTPLWTPGSGKSIFLTAMQVSVSGAVDIQLNRGGNNPFMTLILTNNLATFSESFPSPISFNVDEGISLTTNVATTVHITLFGYEL